MILKNGVKIKGIKPETVIGIMFAESIWKTTLNTNDPMIITSITEGKHMNGSLHYNGYAFDIRINLLTFDQKYALIEALKNHMDLDFDIIFEESHIHIEFDPIY